MKIEVLRRLLEKNDATADQVRARLAIPKITMFNMMGSPGSGKTTLLEACLKELSKTHRCGVLEGDLQTTKDAERIAALDVPVLQILTEGGCHLDAGLVDRALDKLDLSAFDCLFVENVGNLVCLANYDVGEHARVVVLSVAEGDDKPLKYPYMFQRCQAIVISKCDLASACRFDLAQAKADIRQVNPESPIFEVSAYEGQGCVGMDRMGAVSNYQIDWFVLRVVLFGL